MEVIGIQRNSNWQKLSTTAMIAEALLKGREMLLSAHMELAIQIQVEELPEGLFLATSDDLPGLVAQGRTVAEALDIARDVARKLIEARREREGNPN
jgi:predicted RNase H-like HicB family nuclease